QLTEVDRRTRLADDVASQATAQVLVDLGLDRVDDLQLVATFERLEVAVEPLADNQVGGSLQDLAAEARSLEYSGHVQDGMLSAASTARILGAQRLVGFEQRECGEAEGILHTRSPVAVELATKDAQRIGGGLVAIPAQAR